MLGAEMIVSSVISDNSTTTMTDRNTIGFLFYGVPTNNGPQNQDFIFHWGFLADEHSYFSFTRPLITGKTNELDILSCQYMLWALGADGDVISSLDAFSQHPTPGTVLLIDWTSNTTQNTIKTERNLTLIKIHGGLMIFAFLYLAVLGAFIPRFLKEDFGQKGIWLTLHILFQVSVLGLAYAGLGFGVAFLNDSTRTMNQTAHRVIGYILLSLLGLQIIIGLITVLISRKSSKSDYLSYVQLSHKLNGYLILLVACVNAWLGLHEFNNLPETSLTGTSTVSWVLLSVYIGLAIGGWISLMLLAVWYPFLRQVRLAIWGMWGFVGLGLLLPTAILLEN